MDDTADDYDPRYLAGVMLFNAGAFFEAHELWEDLWAEAHGLDRRFYQGLLQAAVGLCHLCNGNLAGAVKLYHSSRDYLRPCGERYLGLDLSAFERQMDDALRPLLETPPRRISPDAVVFPRLELTPPPAAWPDSACFLAEDD